MTWCKKFERTHCKEKSDGGKFDYGKINLTNVFVDVSNNDIKKYVKVKIECLGPQRGRLPWATQYMTNDGRNFALPITDKKSVSKGVCSA